MLEAGIVGLPGSGKTTLFTALTGGQGAVGTVPIPDERLEPVARTVGAAKMTPATLQLVEVAGTGPAMLGNLRKMDALLGVVDGFSGTRDPDGDRESLGLELLIADRDHVERRLERVRSQAKSGDPRLKEEVASLERVLAHLEAGRPLPDSPPPQYSIVPLDDPSLLLDAARVRSGSSAVCERVSRPSTSRLNAYSSAAA